MLLFSTTLEISDSMTVDDFISLVIEWNHGSITKHPENVIPNIVWNGEHNIRYGNNILWMDIQEYRNKNITAVRYEKWEEDGVIWDTDYVMNFDTRKMTIRLERSYTEDALSITSNFSAPYFITLLIDRGYVIDDIDLPITYNPLYITNKNSNLLTDVITLKKEYKLPIVYVSKTEYDTDPVNVSLLSWKLKGAAHVLVQSSKLMNDSLLIQCHQQIEKNGEIGIYYPKQTYTSRRYGYWAESGFDEKLQKVVTKTVLQYCNVQLVSSLCTWVGVNNALLQDRLLFQREQRTLIEQRLSDALLELSQQATKNRENEDIEEKANALANEILDEFMLEMDDYKTQNERLLREVARLQSDNDGLRKKLSVNSNEPILFMGDREQDFYPGEIKDLVISTLKKGLKDVPSHSRRQDVVRDVINSNDYLDTSKQRAKEADRLLKSYSRMTPKIRKGLEELGFVFYDEGKHYKTKYYDDDRYIVMHAKTPSDVRTGKNNASETKKVAF